ncbi:hypothetical protein EH31_02950 [Erythrobacter longus]|uniref:Terminase n=1 Tax=Erythrobacter longus TaxID=1044 RepID=A0A074MFU6_ERYLO|nr:hypothetical protein [Erythrobacter longus]KEO91645.1 hypothetical protein EH31_02950 [Erythrobacter longus]
MTRRADPRTSRSLVPRGQLPSFTPVPRQYERHDGWTPERQQNFIEALADTGSVASACKKVDMSTVGAYHLRRQEGAESFRKAWKKALDLGIQQLEDVAMERALHGVDEPVYSYGELVGVRKKVNDRLLMFMLRNRAPERFGNAAAKGGGSLKGLNAVGRMEKRRLKKKWRAKFRAEWEAEQVDEAKKRSAPVTVQAIRENIDAKIAGIRREVELTRQREWEQFSEETRKAWKAFEALRNADFERLEADEAFRRRHERGSRETVNCEPFDWRKKPEPPRPRKTVHGLKDDGWDEREPEQPSS